MPADRDYGALIRRWLWLVLLAGLVSGSAAYVASKHMNPTYSATATLLINATQSPNSLTYEDVLLSEGLTKTYSQIAVQPVVLEQVIKDAKLPYSLGQLQGMVTSATKTDTQLITVTSRGSTAGEAQTIANLVAQTFIAQQRQRLATGDASTAVSIVQPALLPSGPDSPKVQLNAALGTIAGVLLAAGIIFLITYLDNTVKTQQDVESAFDLPVLGVVQKDAEEAKLQITATDIKHHRRSAEMFRIISANLDFATVDNHARLLIVTSTQKGEGKSTTAAKLAMALAEAGKRVILVDADLRLPTIHRIFRLENLHGLTNLLVKDGADPDEFLKPTPLPTLQVLVSGPTPPNPTALLQSESMATLLGALADRVDTVVLDSPPVLAVADAMRLASQAQGILLVVESGKTHSGRVAEAITLLRRTGTPILGVVLNKIDKELDRYYYGDRYSSYYRAAPTTGSTNGHATEAALAPAGSKETRRGRQ